MEATLYGLKEIVSALSPQSEAAVKAILSSYSLSLVLELAS